VARCSCKAIPWRCDPRNCVLPNDLMERTPILCWVIGNHGFKNFNLS
jgi:hypothetical protein